MRGKGDSRSRETGQIRWMNVTDYLQRHGKVKQVVFEGEPFTALSVVTLGKKLLG
ncbi:MAG TPA: hypothetical protein VKU00_24125 [Chthonomonadaceae bacterium]|nr:hypothetical protein [Chthonomonadaceae bacterium]